MTEMEEQEQPEVILVTEEEMDVRPLFDGFYKHLHDASPNDAIGPNSLSDTSFDRMMHERVILGFLVGRIAARGALEGVLKDAELREGKTVTADELPHMIVRSLVRIRENGEWDNSPQSKETRKQLLAKGVFDHSDYPLISEAIILGDMLKHDGHEAYAMDAVAATTKWLERVERVKSHHPDSHTTSGPAA